MSVGTQIISFRFVEVLNYGVNSDGRHISFHPGDMQGGGDAALAGELISQRREAVRAALNKSIPTPDTGNYRAALPVKGYFSSVRRGRDRRYFDCMV